MSANWEQVYSVLLKSKDDIVNQSKRAIKKEVPKGEACRHGIRDNLVTLFNNIVKYIKGEWSYLDDTQRLAVRGIFTIIREKVEKSFDALNINYPVPISCLEEIDLLLLKENSVTEEGKEELSNMAMTKLEFFNLASKLMPQVFDGSPEKLLSFLDSLHLLNANCENHATSAVAFVKTRLSGKARDLITTEDSVTDIINTLKTKVKYESSRSSSAKLLNCRQNHKDATSFATEIEKLAENLNRAYISEGVPSEVAGRYTTEQVVKSLSVNSNTEKSRVVMEAGTFNSVQEAVTKFVDVNTAASSNTPHVLFTRAFRRNNYYRGGGRRHYDNNYRNNYRQSCNNNSERARRNNRFDSNNENRQRGYRNNQNVVRNVRILGANSNEGNELHPQQAMLGEM